MRKELLRGKLRKSNRKLLLVQGRNSLLLSRKIQGKIKKKTLKSEVVMVESMTPSDEMKEEKPKKKEEDTHILLN